MMPQTVTYKTVVIANPFWDETAYVTELFLHENALEKGGTTLAREGSASQSSQVQVLWERAQQHRTSEQEMPGRSGGSGSNLMIPFVKLGKHTCAILGRIGNDAFGVQIEKHLSGLGVKSLLVKSQVRQTGTVLCFITPDKERTMVAGLGATLDLNPDDLNPEQLQDFNHWHIEGYIFKYGIVPKCLTIAAERNATITLNLPTSDFVKDHRDAILKSIPHCSIVVGNKEELQTLTGREDIHEAFDYFSENQIIAATDGANGCWVKEKGKKTPVHYSTPKIDKEKLLNKTGAGDVWAGCFIALALQGQSIEVCVNIANQGAGDWIQQRPGTYTTDKTWETFRKIVFKNP